MSDMGKSYKKGESNDWDKVLWSKGLLYRVFVLGQLLKNHYGMGAGIQEDYEGSL